MENERKKIINSRPIFYCFLALLLGITVARFVINLSAEYIAICVLLFAGLLAFCIYSKRFAVFLGLLLVFLVGVLWFFVGTANFRTKEYSGTVQIEARVTDDISSNGSYTTYLLEDVLVDGESELNIYLKVYTTAYSLSAGDIVSFSGTLTGNKLFSLGTFNLSYYRDSAGYTCSPSGEITVTGSKLKPDEKFRLSVKSLLYGIVGEDYGAQMYAVLFGDKSDLDDTTYDTFSLAGIIHILSVSGLHVTFLITLLGYFLNFLKVNRYANFAICLVVVLFYAYLCGFTPSVLRAGIMGLVLLFAKFSGKAHDNLNALGLAGILILLFSPLSALDNGFLMSFFCVLGIFVIFPWASKGLRKIFPSKFADALAISFSTQVATLPFLASFYSTFNLLSIFANLFVLPVFSLVYPILLVGTLLALSSPFFSFIITLAKWGFWVIDAIAKFFASSVFLIELKPMHALLVTLVFVMLFLVSKFVMTSARTKRFLTCVLVAIFIISGVTISCTQTTTTQLLYSFEYNTQMAIFTNSSGETLVVDGYDYEFINNALNVINAKDVVGRLALDKVLSEADGERLGGKSFYHSGVTAESGTLVSLDTTYTLGGFSFTYTTLDGKLIGICVSYDGVSCFVVKDENFNENVANYIYNQNFYAIMIGENESFSTLDAELVLAKNSGDYVDYSFSQNGSINIVIGENGKKLRSVD